MQSIQHQEPIPPTEPTPAAASRLRTVTGNRFPRKCACGCGFQIPRDPEVRYVVDFGGPRPYPAYLRERSPDYGTYRGKPRVDENARSLPGFVPARASATAFSDSAARRSATRDHGRSHSR